ncbi:MAG: hypothetical protein U0350_30640 [Caldilineaceae bacterium]
MIFSLFAAIVLTVLLYILPGRVVLYACWPGHHWTWGEQIGLSSALSLSLYPLLVLWAYVFHRPLQASLAWLPVLFGVAGFLWQERQTLRNVPAFFKSGDFARFFAWDYAHNYLLVLLLGLLVVTRLWPVQSMVAPAWGDSVHHTLIVQLLREHGGLFHDWAPYAPMRTFSYHFGFHTAVAAWSWLSGMETAQAVIIAGQMLNVLAVVALYPLAVRLAGDNAWAGLAALIVGGLLSPMPGFYVNWGRYTQMAGQIILPAALWVLDFWWLDRKIPHRRFVLLIGILAAGCVLTHYRIAVIIAAGGLGWGLWALWRERCALRTWFMQAGYLLGGALLAVLLVMPWITFVRSGQLVTIATAIGEGKVAAQYEWADLAGWRGLDTYYPHWLWLAGLVAFLPMLWRRFNQAMPFLLWLTFAFLATNPFLLHLPGAGWITNFLIIIAFYIVLAIVLGWFLGAIWQWLMQWPSGRAAILVTLVGLAGWGAWTQLHIVEPFYQMVTPADQQALTWIKQHTPLNAKILVNGFLAYENSVVVGSDAGWWVPFYTARTNTVPPILYISEQLVPPTTIDSFRQFAVAIKATNGEPTKLREVLCNSPVTHVFLGERQGQVGFDAKPLVPIAWLTQNSDFTRLFQQDNATVWAFARTVCH